MPKASVRLVALLVALASAARAQEAQQDPAKYEAGKRAFSAGVALLQDPEGARYEEALAQFGRAYELTNSWKALGNMALCLFKLERDGEAIAAYEKYLQVAASQLDAGDRAQVERDLLALKAQVVSVKLELPEAGATLTDERTDGRGNKIVNEYSASSPTIELGLHPGRHTITAKTSKGQGVFEARLEPGSSVSHKFEISEAKAATSGSATPQATSFGQPAAPGDSAGGPDLRIPAYASFGVAAIGIGFGTLFALKSHSSRKDADALCNGDNCPVSKHDEIEGLQQDANDQGRLAFIGFVAGGVAAATGVTLLLVSGGKKEPAKQASVAPWVGVASAGLTGRF